MAARMRALSLTAHVSTSLGWFGAVATFLVCKTIISGQQAEIDQMKAKLRDLGN